MPEQVPRGWAAESGAEQPFPRLWRGPSGARVAVAGGRRLRSPVPGGFCRKWDGALRVSLWSESIWNDGWVTAVKLAPIAPIRSESTVTETETVRGGRGEGNCTCGCFVGEPRTQEHEKIPAHTGKRLEETKDGSRRSVIV